MPQPDKKKSSYQQELERRSNDLLRVYNPTSKDYVIEWDRKNGTKLFRVPAKEEAIFPRYIAEKYIREMFDQIIINKADEAVKRENERRIKSGMAIMDKTMKSGEQQQFESQFYLGNDQNAREIISILYVGIETEFGVDRVASEAEEREDRRPSFDRAMDTVQQEKNNGISPNKNNNNDSASPQSHNPLECTWPDCGFIAKDNRGLIAHKRKHRPSEEHIEENKETEDKKSKAVAQVSQT